MKHKHILYTGILFLIITIGVCLFWFCGTDPTLLGTGVQTRAPQSSELSSAQMNAMSFDETLGAWQGIAVGRGVTTPQSSELSKAQMDAMSFNESLGAWQMVINEPLDLSYLNLSSTTPYLKMHNTTEEDGDGGRESYWSAQGEQSGGEISTLGKISISHWGSSNDEIGQIKFDYNDGDDANSPSWWTRLYTNGSANILDFSEATFFTDEGNAVLHLDQSAGRSTSYLNFRLLDNKMHWFGTDADYSLGYNSADDTLRIADGNDLTTTPRLILEPTGEFKFQAGIVPDAVIADPCGSGYPEGTLFYNDTGNVLCFCNGTDDLKVHDNSACF